MRGTFRPFLRVSAVRSAGRGVWQSRPVPTIDRVREDDPVLVDLATAIVFTDAQAAAVRAALEEEGFVAIGLDHFAHPDDPLAIAARNFLMASERSSRSAIIFSRCASTSTKPSRAAAAAPPAATDLLTDSSASC